MYANNRRRLQQCLDLGHKDELPVGLVRQVEQIEECLEKLNQHHKIPDTEIALLSASYVTMEEDKPAKEEEKKPAPKKSEKKDDPFPAGKKG